MTIDIRTAIEKLLALNTEGTAMRETEETEPVAELSPIEIRVAEIENLALDDMTGVVRSTWANVYDHANIAGTVVRSEVGPPRKTRAAADAVAGRNRRERSKVVRVDYYAPVGVPKPQRNVYEAG